MPFLIWAASIIEFIKLALLNVFFLLLLQLANGLIWYYEEKSSSEAIALLKKSLEPKAKVKRDGVWKIIEAKFLVVGDKIFLTTGDLLPADCILGTGECNIDQSMLTGETTAIYKVEGNKVYMGSICKKGEIEAFVINIGKNTFFGKRTQLSSKVEDKGRIQKVLTKITLLLIIVSSVLTSILFIVLLVKGNEFLESLAIAVMLMIISSPIAIQVVCATTLAVGAKALKKKHAVVSRLSSIEELASIQTLFINKSGFLTKARPEIQTPILIQSKKIEEIVLVAYLACKREGGSQNFIDKCISKYAIESKINIRKYEEENFNHYNPKQKRTMATVRDIIKGELIQCCKGAPQVVLALTEKWELEPQVSEVVLKLADQGISSLAVAKKSKKGKWKFCGIIPLLYNIRKEAEVCIKKLKALNIKITLVTGDQLAIAKSTCLKLKIGDRIFNADIFNNDNTTVQRECIDSIIAHSDGYAEVYPEHKFILVKMYQRKKIKVGIAGVSISDVSALKRANVGFAAYGATDAAMTGSDIIFHRPGLNILIQSVIRARKIFQRAETYCIYRISCSFQLLTFFFVIALSINPGEYDCSNENCDKVPNSSVLPVITLVIIAFLNNGTIISIAYDRSPISLYPKKWNIKIIILIACIVGTVAFLSSLVFFLIGIDNMDSKQPNKVLEYFGVQILTYNQVLTGTFLKISLSNYLTIFSVRTKSFFLFNLPGKTLSLIGIGSMILSTLLCRYWFLNSRFRSNTIIADLAPIYWDLILIIWTYDICIFILQDFIKVMVYKAFDAYYARTADEDLTKMTLEETYKSYYKSTSPNILTKRSRYAAMV